MRIKKFFEREDSQCRRHRLLICEMRRILTTWTKFWFSCLFQLLLKWWLFRLTRRIQFVSVYENFIVLMIDRSTNSFDLYSMYVMFLCIHKKKYFNNSRNLWFSSSQLILLPIVFIKQTRPSMFIHIHSHVLHILCMYFSLIGIDMLRKKLH